MTEQTDFAIAQQDPTRWQKLLAWLSRVDEAMNYDPMVHAAETVRHLGEKVTRLESRVAELERHSQHTT